MALLGRLASVVSGRSSSCSFLTALASPSAVGATRAAHSSSSYKSPISLEKLYGCGADAIADAPQPPASNESTFSGYIPIKELTITYCRSSGPGGQHVNKTNTKATVRFHVDSAKWIPKEAKEKLKAQCASAISKEGDFIISSDRTRKQAINTADCIDRIRSIIFEACKPPPEVSKETLQMIKDRMERASAVRLREKRMASQKRRERQPDSF